MNLAQRLTRTMKEKGITQAELGKAVGVSQTTIWKLMTGKTHSNRRLLQIAEYLKVDVSWLSGTEKKIKNDGIPLSEIKNITVDDWDDKTPLDVDEVEVPFYRSIELAAGHCASNMEDYNGFKLRFAKSFLRKKGAQKDHVICFPVHGDSMEPRIPDGATVAVDTGKKDVIDGNIYAICQSGLCRIKRLYRMPNNKIRINSYNSIDNPDETDDLANVEIIGRVFYFSADL